MEKLYDYLPQQLVTFILVTLFSLLIGLSQRRISLRREGETTLFGTDRTFTFIGILGYLLYILDPKEMHLFMGGGIILGMLLGINYYVKQSQFHVFGVTTIGGLYSSTATISILARKCKRIQTHEIPEYVSAMMLAISMMFLRFMILILIFSTSIFLDIYPYLLIMSVTAAGIGIFIHKKHTIKGEREVIEEPETESNPLEFKVALIFALLFVVFTFLTHYTLIYAGTGGLSILSIAAGLSDITPFILNLLQGGSIPATIVGACIMQAIISNIVVNMFYAIFFSSRRKEILPYVWKGFLTVIGINAVLLLIYYF